MAHRLEDFQWDPTTGPMVTVYDNHGALVGWVESIPGRKRANWIMRPAPPNSLLGNLKRSPSVEGAIQNWLARLSAPSTTSTPD
jgi:hypothetical protein